MRWQLAEADGGQGALFEEVLGWHAGKGEYRNLEFLHVRAQRIINTVPPQSRVPFTYTINPYRGCSHACVYCFSRPTHEYLDLGAGEDFERKIVVKVNAVERLRAELHTRRWQGEPIAMGTNTDPYQRCEGKYRLTRGIIETLGQFKNPFSILTKGTLILRDLDVLQAAAAHTTVRANFSIGTLDETVWRETEPGTPHPMRRVEAVARLNQAGIPTGVLVAPILPGISDDAAQLDAVVKACVDAGAVSISGIMLHLRKGVRELFEPWLKEHHPELRERYAALYPRAYAAAADQDQLAKRIRAAVAKHGGTAMSPLYMRDSPDSAPSRPARIDWPARRRARSGDPEQLALLPPTKGH